jgi:hypothetical protein
MASFFISFWRSFSIRVDKDFLAMKEIYKTFSGGSTKKDLHKA